MSNSTREKRFIMSRKRQFLAASFSLALVSCIPQKALAEENAANHDLPQIGAHSFQESLQNALEGGLCLSFDSFLLEAEGRKAGSFNSF
ncbi:MAG: hypothetical protein J5736_05750, partial [Bacilli bacterium]|nr:hypothetical protein [Bacilli bacterium]